jgi:hypothetical protein
LHKLGDALTEVDLVVLREGLYRKFSQVLGRKLLLLSHNHLLDLVMVSVSLRLLSVSEDGVLNIFNLFLSLLGCHLARHLNLFDFSLRLSLDPRFFAYGFGL